MATVDTSTFARRHGGFGGKVTETPVPHAVPDAPPDIAWDLPTAPNQALLYRLSGDENPLHADPERAKVAGFERPILHGAASFGIAAHAVLRMCADYRPERLASIEARFSKPVLPGDTLTHRDVGRRPAHLVPVPGRRARRYRAQQRPGDAAVLTLRP